MESFQKYTFLALIAALTGAIIWIVLQKNHFETKLDQMYNKLAETAETVKIRDGEFQKMMLKLKDLDEAIDTSTQQGKDLAEQLKDTKARLLTVTNTQIEIKKEVISLKDLINKPRPDGSWEFAVKKQQGLLGVDGSCFSGPTKDSKSSCELTLAVKPWELVQTVDQQPDGSWQVRAAVPPEVELKFGKVAVNPLALTPGWKERLNFSLQALANSKEGAVIVGAGYKIDNLNLSLHLGGATAGSDHIYYGAGLTYFPWEK